MNLDSFRKSFLYLTLCAGLLSTSSCDDDSTEAKEPKGAYERGVFITNEGSYGTPTGEVSYLETGTKIIIPDLFNQVNGRVLGDVVQSMTVHNDLAYIVANNSNKIEVVNANTFKEMGVIKDLKLPRYMVALNNTKGYVTEYVGLSYFGYTGTGRVSVLDLTNNTVTKTINVGILPEAALLYNGKLYVANGGGTSISVINTITDVVEATIEVGKEPSQLVLDANNKIWAIRGAYGETGALVKIDPAANHAVTSYTIPGSGKLALNGSRNTLYYSSGGKIYAMSMNATAAPTTPLIGRNPYGLGVDPVTNQLYLGVGGYQSNGWVVRYENTGARIDSFQVRILPNGFTFR